MLVLPAVKLTMVGSILPTLFVALLFFGTLAITVPSRVVSVVLLIINYLIGVLIALLLQLELIGMAVLIVYMGAIAVFFLFIVMVLGGNAAPRRFDTQ
jgi:NADH:ubiquinone oxidoreductase subunit 6 (subunit J)